jgi:hypothetical protein
MDGISQNYECYILMFIIIVYIILGILFHKCGYPTICSDIKEIIGDKEEKEKNINANETIDKNNKEKVESNEILKIKNNAIINPIIVDSNNNNSKSFSKLELQKNNNLNNLENLENNYQNKDKENSISYNDYELNSMPYRQALQYDKRSLFQYYISLLRTKHPLIFAFCPLSDYNSRLIKISIFLLFFSTVYTINGFFFLDNSIIHKIYENAGKYNLELPTLYSFILSQIFYIIIKYIFLSERNIAEIKNAENAEKASDKVDNVQRTLVIKYIILYVVGTLFLGFCWYYLSSFGAVYQNTQVYLMDNTLISLAFSFVYPFAINIIPGILRSMSLSSGNKDKGCLYKASQFIQLI